MAQIAPQILMVWVSSLLPREWDCPKFIYSVSASLGNGPEGEPGMSPAAVHSTDHPVAEQRDRHGKKGIG